MAEKRIDRYPQLFSGSTRQRAVTALALCAHTRYIIADEPTTALNVSIQTQILNISKRLRHGDGIAIMPVTHDTGVIAETGDGAAVMYAGKSLADLEEEWPLQRRTVVTCGQRQKYEYANRNKSS